MARSSEQKCVFLPIFSLCSSSFSARALLLPVFHNGGFKDKTLLQSVWTQVYDRPKMEGH